MLKIYQNRLYKLVYSSEPRFASLLSQIHYLDKKLPKRKRFKINQERPIN